MTTGEEGGSICKVRKGAEYKGIGGERGFNVLSESEVQGVDDNRFGNNGSIDIIQGSVNEILTREGISGGHLGTREDFPDDIKVLEEEGPASLASRQLVRVL